MPAVQERGGVTLNNHIADYLKADREFIHGIKKGVEACKAGDYKSWEEVKKELRIK
jgi:hypothetical protein